MRILLIAEPYMNLHLPIIKELEAQGHYVKFFKDSHLDFDWREGWRGIRDRLTKRIKSSLSRNFQKYWDKQFHNDPELKQRFDQLIVINGCSYHPHLMKLLKFKSPNLKTTLYLWDNSAFYRYFHYSSDFDNVLTYDLDDSIKYNAKLLPFYYTEEMTSNANQNRYLISMIGTNHDNRLDICRKIYTQLNQLSLEEIAITQSGINDIKEYLKLKVLDNSLPEDDIVTHSRLSLQETMAIFKNSFCVLDTDRESQSGTTPRLIWAIAMKKKVITTNQNIKRMWFYNPLQIHIIDRTNPIIDVDFLKKTLPDDFKVKDLENLHIKNWVKSLIN